MPHDPPYQDTVAYASMLNARVAFRMQRGEVAAEVGAGIYFEERRGLAGSLHRLLQVCMHRGCTCTGSCNLAQSHIYEGEL
jgi:hypothetical protein